ncbi:MAG: homoaconitate hydratase, partial [Cyanobacteria bacterium J06639_1]
VNCPVPPWKAIVGTNTFAHESGIHAHGVLHDPSTYEPFDPAEVGGKRRLVVGKHSGRRLLDRVLQNRGIQLDRDRSQLVLHSVRDRATHLKRSLTIDELLAVVSGEPTVAAAR